MKLQDYLKKKKIPVAKAAKELGYTRQRLYQVLAGTSPPGRVLTLKIIAWSNGKVDLRSLIELDALEKQITDVYDPDLSRKIDSLTDKIDKAA